MPLSGRSRSAIFQKLGDVVDQQSIEQMQSSFPARDVEERGDGSNLTPASAVLGAMVALT